MFFKNIMTYRFNRDIEFVPEQLEKLMKDFMFTPCGDTDKSKFGWVEPMGKYGECFTHVGDGDILITARKQVKNVPAENIKAELNARVDRIEEVEGRPLKKAEKDAIRESVIDELLPRAFTRTANYNVLIMPKEGLIVLDCSSHKIAEDVLALLRRTIGSLPVVPVIPNCAMETVATEWVKEGQYPAGFTAGEKVKLVSVLQEGGKVNFTNQNLASEEVLINIKENKVVSQIELNWQDSIDFVITDQYAIKSVKWADEIKERNDDIPREDVAARFDSDFHLAKVEIKSFLSMLFEAFGGLPKFDTSGDITEDFDEAAKQDPRLGQARDHFSVTGRVSISSLQRHLLIGYATACDLIAKLERCGVVSEADTMGRRELILNKDPE